MVVVLLGVVRLHRGSWRSCRAHNRGSELDFDDLVLVPNAMDDLVFGLINSFSRSIFLIIFPVTFVLEPSDQVDMSATSMLHIRFERALIDLLIGLLKLTEAVEFTFFEFSDILEVRTD